MGNEKLSVLLFYLYRNMKFLKGVGNIGRVLVMEFREEDSIVFDEVMMVLKQYPNFKKLYLDNETVISLSGLAIYPEQRKVYSGQQEIHLTVKEYDLLCLLVSNKGQILTYAQIYEKVWGETYSGSENKTIKYHIYNLREKLYAVSSDEKFMIRCVREIGYCFEENSVKST